MKIPTEIRDQLVDLALRNPEGSQALVGEIIGMAADVAAEVAASEETEVSADLVDYWEALEQLAAEAFNGYEDALQEWRDEAFAE